VSIDGGATYQVQSPVRYGFLHQELNTEYIIIVDKEEYLVTLRKSALFVHEV